MNLKVLKRLSHYLKNYKGKFVISVLAAFLGALFTVIAPRLLGDVTTVLYAGITDQVWYIEKLPDGTANPASVWVQGPFMPIGKMQAVIWLITVLAVMYVLSFLFNTVANRMMARVASCVVKDIRGDIDHKMHRMKLDYYDTRTNGEILSVITNDVDAVNTLLGKNLFQSITAVITLVGVLAMLFSISGWLALIAALMIPGTLILSGPVMKRGGRSFVAQQNLLGDVNGYVEEIYNGQNVVSSFNYQEKAVERFESLNEELRGAAEKAEKYSGTIMPLTQMVNNIGYALSGLIGCLLALRGYMTVGNIQSALQYTKTAQHPFSTFAQMSSQISTAMAAGNRIFGLLDAEEEIPDPQPGKVPELCNGAVEFRNVRFGYTPDRLLMTDVSFEAKPGQKIAIVSALKPSRGRRSLSSALPEPAKQH